jgi:nucleoside triphosphate pyrophosphatase
MPAEISRPRLKVVLASRSPQRRELLARLGIEFEVELPEVEELGEGDPGDAVLENARRKAAAIASPEALVIGCDTDVVVDGRALGKPVDEDAAREFLELLSGRSHEVLSGLALAGPEPGRVREGVARSVVTFGTVGAADLDRYLASGEWRERAGGYAIQGLGATLAERIEGDLSNVIGLPLSLLLELAPELSPA